MVEKIATDGNDLYLPIRYHMSHMLFGITMVSDCGVSPTLSHLVLDGLSAAPVSPP